MANMNPIKLDKLPVTFQVRLIQHGTRLCQELDVGVEEPQRKLDRVQENADGIANIGFSLANLQNQDRVLAEIEA